MSSSAPEEKLLFGVVRRIVTHGELLDLALQGGYSTAARRKP